MSDLSNYAKKNCKFSGVSEVRDNGDDSITIKIQSLGVSPIESRVVARQERCEKRAKDINPKPFWYCEKPKYPYSAGFVSEFPAKVA